MDRLLPKALFVPGTIIVTLAMAYASARIVEAPFRRRRAPVALPAAA